MTSAIVFTANQALIYGLAHQVVALSELSSAKDQWITVTLGNSPEAVAQIKQLLQVFNNHLPIAKENLAITTTHTTTAIAKIRVSLNGQAGLKAFLTKTPAPWKG